MSGFVYFMFLFLKNFINLKIITFPIPTKLNYFKKINEPAGFRSRSPRLLKTKPNHHTTDYLVAMP